LAYAVAFLVDGVNPRDIGAQRVNSPPATASSPDEIEYL
jgi:hypothetical protein